MRIDMFELIELLEDNIARLDRKLNEIVRRGLSAYNSDFDKIYHKKRAYEDILHAINTGEVKVWEVENRWP